MQTSLYDATFGRAGGGDIQIVTKSGTNDFHGAAYEYFGNDALNANNPFLKAAGARRPVLKRNIFGVTIGGPIKKDKAFFFFSYEGYRLRGGINSIEAVPGLASRICAAPFGTGSVTCNAATVALIPAFRSPSAVSAIPKPL